MSATTSEVRGQRAERANEDRPVRVLRTTETKASFKTSEFIAYLAVLAGIFIAGAVTKAGANAHDVLRANQVWLYASIVTVGYMISRGLAKSGSRNSASRTPRSANSLMRLAPWGLVLAALVFIASGGHILFLPFFFILPLGGLLSQRRWRRRR